MVDGQRSEVLPAALPQAYVNPARTAEPTSTTHPGIAEIDRAEHGTQPVENMQHITAADATGSGSGISSSTVPSTAQADAATTIANANADAPLQPEDDVADEGFEDDVSALTQSIRSSIYDFKFENGRRYHAFKEGKYWGPNDEPEQDRMRMQEIALSLASANFLPSGQTLYHCPVKDPERIVDMGTGLGNWAVAMADQFPKASVVGIDLSPIQDEWVPPNVKFEVDDIEDPWTWPANHFDFVRASLLISGSLANIRKYFEQTFRVLKPGGWTEDSELYSQLRSDHYQIPKDGPAYMWAEYMAEGIAKMGRTMRPDGEEIAKMMEDIGFVNVVYKPFKVPIGTWPQDKTLKESGAHQLIAMLDGLQSLSLAIFTRGLGWRQEEIEVFMATVRPDFRTRRSRYYWPAWIVYGQKPENV